MGQEEKELLGYMISIPPDIDMAHAINTSLRSEKALNVGITQNSRSITIKSVGWLPRTPYQVHNELESLFCSGICTCTLLGSFFSFPLCSSSDEGRGLGRGEDLFFHKHSFHNRCHIVVFRRDKSRS
jgi:hypothetical protein